MKYRVVIEAEISDSPKGHEFVAAIVIAKYFRSDVTFIRPAMFRTPDFDVKGMKWELKSPMGSSARTIENNMRAARKQSTNIIIDLNRKKNTSAEGHSPYTILFVEAKSVQESVSNH